MNIHGIQIKSLLNGWVHPGLVDELALAGIDAVKVDPFEDVRPAPHSLAARAH